MGWWGRNRPAPRTGGDEPVVVCATTAPRTGGDGFAVIRTTPASRTGGDGRRPAVVRATNFC